MAIIANAKVKTYPEPWSGEVVSGKHQLITDKPESFGGQDKGLAPYDFICSGLISCTMITLRMYAQHKGLLPWWLSNKESTCNAGLGFDLKDPLEKEMATHSSILA